MTEHIVKHVKVDNWGAFFLQRLQHFFNKHEFCDLTLVLKNSQKLKVHRLVLNACTEYFQTLEKKHPPGSNRMLQLPEDLEPDVVIPIINFMYTGCLEFKQDLQPRLYSAAKKLNMTVLTKVLDVHNSPSQGHAATKSVPAKKVQAHPQSISSVPVKKTISKQSDAELPKPLPGRKLPIWKRRSAPTGLISYVDDKPVVVSSPVLISKGVGNCRQEDLPGPMRFDWPEEELKPQTYYPSFDDITYETKILVKSENKTATPQLSPPPVPPVATITHTVVPNIKQEAARTAIFEEVRRTAVAVKRPSVSESTGSTPEKQPKMVDLQAVKEYVQEHQLRKDLVEVEDNGEDVDDDLAVADLDDYDEDDVEGEEGTDWKETTPLPRIPPLSLQPAKSILKSQPTQVAATPPKRVRFSLDNETSRLSEGKENESKIRTSSVSSAPASGSTNTKAPSSPPVENLTNHAKIITEVLKKYPHLVKSNKNIKLKILQRGQNSSLNSSNLLDGKVVKSKVSYVVLKSELGGKGKPLTGNVALKHGNCVEPLSQLSGGPLTASSGTASASVKTPPLLVSRPIASGAENTTGPWLCYTCGTEGNPINFETYYLYRRHLQDVHMEKIDARICEHCGHRASKRNLLLYHLYTKHNVPPPRNCQFPRCDQCEYVALSESLLIKHRNNHTNNREFVCKVCNATFKSNGALQGHIQANLHSDPAKKTYECPICRKPFVRNINLKAHVRSAHGDIAKKMEKGEPVSEILSDNRGDSVMSVQQGKSGTVMLGQGVTVVTPTSQGPAQTLVPSSEAEALSNVASGIAASLGLTTDALTGEQTVIVLDNSREYVLQSTGDTEVQEYAEATVHTDPQEYIVPDIMPTEEVHQFEGSIVTTAAGTSYTTVVQQPALGQTTTQPTAHVTHTTCADDIGVVISDHDYANEVTLRGMPGDGMMFIITQPRPDGNTILQAGHMETSQQQTNSVHLHQIQHTEQEQMITQQQDSAHQHSEAVQHSQPQLTMQQEKSDHEERLQQYQQEHHHRNHQIRQQHHLRQQQELLQRQQQLLQQQLLEQQEQCLVEKQSETVCNNLHQQLMETNYIVPGHDLEQGISGMIVGAEVKVKDETTVNQADSIVIHGDTMVSHPTVLVDQIDGVQSVEIELPGAENKAEHSDSQKTDAELAKCHMNSGVSSGEDSNRVEECDLQLEAGSMAQPVPSFEVSSNNGASLQHDESQLVMAEMQNVVPDGPGLVMPDESDARRMASDLVKEWDEFDEDSCEFVGGQLIQKSKDSQNGGNCIS